MANPQISINKTINLEGGYNKNLGDNAGETYKGLTRRYDSNFKGWYIIDAAKPLREEQKINSPYLDFLIYDYYKNKYWKLAQGDSIKNQQIADLVFDTIVTSGQGIKNVVQKAINKAAASNKDIKAVPYTNVMDFATVQALNNNSNIYPYIWQARKDYFLSLPTSTTFQKGWLNRLNNYPESISLATPANFIKVTAAAGLIYALTRQ